MKRQEAVIAKSKTTPLLSVLGAVVEFGGIRALDGVDMQCMSGHVTGVIGPNGSGKTTLFNAITGMVPVVDGRASMNGHDLFPMRSHEISRIGVARTFQHSRAVGGLTILENLLIGAMGGSGLIPSAYRSRKRAESALKPHLDRALGLLSRFAPPLLGMLDARASDIPYVDRRRVEICAALASQPQLLLLDEPTAGMSPEETDKIMADIGEVRRQLPGMSTAIVEHDMRVISGIADNVVVLNQGKKIAEGPYELVSTDPAVREAYLGSRQGA